MDKQRWQVASIGDVPASPPYDGREGWAPYTDDPLMGSGWHSIADHLGVRAFGVNANEAPEGHIVVPPHDELQYGEQEELYVVLRGRARFELDGQSKDVGAGEMVFVGPAVQRHAVALESPTVVLTVGGTAGKAFGA